MKQGLFLLVCILLCLSVTVIAGQTRSTGKSVRQAPATAASKKSAAENTCDGALDIVPTQALSFTRKRRPSRPAEATPVTTEKKSSEQR